MPFLASLFGSAYAKLAEVLAIAAAVSLVLFKVRQDGVQAAQVDQQNAELAQVKEYKKIEENLAGASRADLDKRVQPFYRD